MALSKKTFDCQSILSMPRDIFTPQHEEFRAKFKLFIQQHILPHYNQWEKKGVVSRALYDSASSDGYYLRMSIPVEYGGMGVDDFRYNAIVAEELEHCDVGGIFFTLGNDMVLSYFTKSCNDEQKKRWLPKIANEKKILAVAMSEPEIGSDLAGAGTLLQTTRH